MIVGVIVHFSKCKLYIVHRVYVSSPIFEGRFRALRVRSMFPFLHNFNGIGINFSYKLLLEDLGRHLGNDFM